MQLYVTNPRVFLVNNRLITLVTVIYICIFLLTSSLGITSEPNSCINDHRGTSMAVGNNAAKNSNGSTMIMCYSKENFEKNPIASFAYFIPLVAPTLVDNISSLNNGQQVNIISHKIITDSKSFHVECEFEILGSGFHINTFDSAGMIAAQTDDLIKKTMTNMLDYIKFEGDGFGIIEVKGTITGSARIVTEVDKFGNMTVLEFGYTLLQKKTTFTFPKAKNIKESRIVGSGPILPL